MTLPDGWEYGPDGEPRPVRKRYRLTDLVIDEVSIVKRGANQRAHIVLVKSDQDEPAGLAEGEATPWHETATGRKRLARRHGYQLEHEIADESFSVAPDSVPLVLNLPDGAWVEDRAAKAVASFYGANPDAYEAQLGRNVGKADRMAEDLEDPWGPASSRYAKADELAKHYSQHPSDYDELYGPKVQPVKKSSMALVLQSLTRSDNAKAIAKMLADHPELYDALLEGDHN